jgi:hypothetical protein
LILLYLKPLTTLVICGFLPHKQAGLQVGFNLFDLNLQQSLQAFAIVCIVRHIVRSCYE